MGKLFKSYPGDHEELSFVGSHIPVETHSFLSLYGVYKGKARSKLIREILEKWKQEEHSVDFLLTKLVHKATGEWDTGYWSDQQEFLIELRDGLEKRGVHEQHIDYIEKKVKEHIYGGKNKRGQAK